MTYRVIGEDGAYLIQAKYRSDGAWYVVSGTYDTSEKAIAVMNEVVTAKRREVAALAAAPIVVAEVTI